MKIRQSLLALLIVTYSTLALADSGTFWKLARDGEWEDAEAWLDEHPDLNVRFKPIGQDKSALDFLLDTRANIRQFPNLSRIVFENAHDELQPSTRALFMAGGSDEGGMVEVLPIREGAVAPYSGILTEQDVDNILALVRSGKVKTVVFDLDGVLLQTNMEAVSNELTAKEKAWFALWTATHFRKPDRRFLFDMLAAIAPDERFKPQYQVYNEGMRLPPVMCLWQAGVIKSGDALILVRDAIARARAENQITRRDAHVIAAMSRMAFQVDTFVRTRSVVPAGLKLLTELSKDIEGGNKDLKVALLTNFDVHAFDLIKQGFPDIFSKIPDDHILVSADVEQVKPSSEIYLTLRDQVGFDTETAMMVDDERMNGDGALRVYRYAYVTSDGLHEAKPRPGLLEPEVYKLVEIDL